MASKKLTREMHTAIDTLIAMDRPASEVIAALARQYGVTISAPAVTWHRRHCTERIDALRVAFQKLKERQRRDREDKRRKRAHNRAEIAARHCNTCTCESVAA